MTSAVRLGKLVESIARERNAEKALDLIAAAALELTGSGHAMLALMNDELGYLEMKHGAGDEFEERAKNGKLEIGSGFGIIAYVAATGETVISGNVKDEPRYHVRFESTASEIAVPIRDQFGRIRGVVNVESERLNAYNEEASGIVEAIAAATSVVLERQEHMQREEALLEIGSALDSALTEESLIDQVIHVAQDVLRFQACSLFLIDRSTDTFVLRGSTSQLKEKVGEIRYGRQEGCTGWVCDTGQPVLLQEPQSDPRWRGRFTEFPSDEIASFLAVPIVYRGQSIGAIRVLRRKPENRYLDVRFTDNDQRVLQAIAEQLATGLNNLRNLELIIRSERMIAWGELSAKSSHMIGNRVFALKGDVNELGHMMKQDEPNLREIAEIQKSLAVNVGRVEEILQEFRDFVSATQLHLEPGDVNELIKETADEVFPKRGEIQLDLDLEPGLPQIKMDAAKLRRAISELIENSIHYMDSGVMRISTRLDKRKKGGSWIRIEVLDSGPGIDEQTKALIFQPFFSGRVKGMGLGLSIVKGIVDAHGGQVFEAGELGKGAMFVILLPT